MQGGGKPSDSASLHVGVATPHSLLPASAPQDGMKNQKQTLQALGALIARVRDMM
jgi:hypothetical protein